MSKKIMFRIVSVVLVVVLVVCQPQIPVYATEIDEDTLYTDEEQDLLEEPDIAVESDLDSGEGDNGEIMSVNEDETPEIQSEITSQREIYSKQYMMSDNTTMVVYYAEPVHYELEDGSFAEIDNSIVQTSLGCMNASNSYSVFFPSNPGEKGTVEFTEGEYEISWKYLENGIGDNSDNSNINIDVETDPVDPGEEQVNGHVIRTGSVTYDGYTNGVSLEYEPASQGVKENIILEEGSNANEFVFELKLKGLSANINPDGEIELYDTETGEIKYYFPAPFMVDSANNESDEVHYSFYSDNFQNTELVNEEETDIQDSDLVDIEEQTDEKTSEEGEDKEVIIDNDADETDEPIIDSSLGTENEYISAISVELNNNQLKEQTNIINSVYENESGDEVTTDEEISDSEDGPNEENNESEDIVSDEDEDFDEDEENNSDNELQEEQVENANEGVEDEIEEADGDIQLQTADDNVDENSDDDTDEETTYLIITADSEWLNTASYPVRIDPIIKKKAKNGLIDYGSVSSKEGQTYSEQLLVGKGNLIRDPYVYRSFVKFELPKLEKTCVVSSAELYLDGKINVNRAHYITAHKITENWVNMENINTKTVYGWDTQPRYDEKPIDYAIAGGYFDITKVVRDWYGGVNNYGLLLKAYEEDKVLKDSLLLNGTVKRPYLKITFRNNIGIEDYYSMHSTSVGTAGKGYINDYSGALTVINNDVSTVGNRMPFTISHIYNSNATPEWRLNLDERIYVPSDEVDINEYPYVYVDGDGTKHYFKKGSVGYLENGVRKVAAGTNLYPSALDEDGLGLCIVQVTDNTLKALYPIKLIDKSSSTVKYFDFSGRLSLISDSNQYENGANAGAKEANRITITYENISDDYIGIQEWSDAVTKAEILKNNRNTNERELNYYINDLKNQIAVLQGNYYTKTDIRVAIQLFKAKTYLEALTYSNSATVKNTRTTAILTAINNAVNYIGGETDGTATGLYQYSKDKRIVSVSDAVANTSVFTYENGKIKTISDPTRNGSVNTYTYSGDNLTQINFASGKIAKYEYTDGLLTSMIDDTEYGIDYVYENGKVSEVHEYNDLVSGQKYSIKYGSDNTTIFRFSGIDDIYGNDDDIINTYVFDEKGRVISQYSKRHDQSEILGAAGYTYESDVKNTALSYNDQTDENIVNLIRNPGFEQKNTAWTIADFSNCDGIVELESGEAFIGSHGAKVKIDPGKNSGLIYQSVYLAAGTYTISCKIKGQNYSGGCGYIGVADLNWNIDERTFTGIDSNNGWGTLTKTFQIDNSQRVYLFLGGRGVGTTYFDCVMLESGSTAHNYTYTESTSNSAAGEKSKPEDKGITKIKDYAVKGRQTQNLLQNHSFEYDDDSWIVHKRTGADNLSVLKSYAGMPYIGNKSFRINMVRLKTGEGGLSQNVIVSKNKKYTLSAYVKTTDLANTDVFIRVTDSNSNEYLSSIIDYSTESSICDGFERLTVTFEIDNTLDADSEDEITVYLGAKAKDGMTGSGQVSIDCVQLEEGDTANQYNILEDGSFELTKGNIPYKWKNLTAVKFSDEICQDGVDGGRCYHIQGEPGKDKYLKFNTNLGTGINSYVLSGWIKCDTTPTRQNRELRVRAYHSDGESVFESALNINAFSTGWKYFTLVLPAHRWSTTLISIQYFDNIGDIYIDDLQLSKNDVCTNEYNAAGAITKKSVSVRSEEYTYDTYGRLSKTIAPSSMTKTNVYNTSNNVTRVMSDFGPDTYFTYDRYGNPVKQETHIPIEERDDGTKTKPIEVYTQNTYTANGNFLAGSTDSNNATKTYNYNTLNGKLESETLPALENDAEITLEYTYDQGNNITTIERTDGTNSREVEYAYGDYSNLTSITHNGFDYSYTYDEFGNVLSTSVAGQNILTNTYNAGNGSLISTKYADNSVQFMKYDEYGNITEVTSKESGTAEEENAIDRYRYYNDGNVAEHIDVQNDISTEYDYNDSDQVIRTRVSGQINGIDYTSRFQYGYNVSGNIETLAYEQGENVKKYKYLYAKDDLPTKSTLPDGSYETNAYDVLRRNIRNIYLPTSSAVDARRLYTQMLYQSGQASSASYTGSQYKVSKYFNKFGSSGAIESGFDYTYDARGNILTINNTTSATIPRTEATNPTRRYTYNIFDEVETATENYSDGSQAEYSYVYDIGGNITSETVVRSGNTTTHQYVYDTTWKDKLVSYDGNAITYDNAGNPTNYMGKAMTWDIVNGSLTGVSGSGDNISYEYLSDGKRLSKDVNGSKTTYIYNNGILLCEETSADKINYYYDSQGNVKEIGYQTKSGTTLSTETYYFFARNGQGDIIAVYRNSDSKLIGTYEYDLWGNLVSAVQATDSRTGEILDTNNILYRNPLRYRGYYYDAETGFYYLNARYYDSVTHRFISPEPNFSCGTFDSNSGLSAYNVYVYCAGNPVVYCDTTGEFILTTMAICCIAGVIVGATAGGVIGNVYADKQGYNGSDKTKCILAGVGIGALAGGICGYFSAPLITSATGIAGVSVSSTGIIVGQNVVSNINSIDANSINHIINGSKGQDHRWYVLVEDMNWNSIRYYVTNTLMYGREEIFGKSAYYKTMKYGEYIVEVRYAVKDEIIKIGDAFVRK